MNEKEKLIIKNAQNMFKIVEAAKKVHPAILIQQQKKMEEKYKQFQKQYLNRPIPTLSQAVLNRKEEFKKAIKLSKLILQIKYTLEGKEL